MMMSFCKKSVHSFLGLATSIDTTSTFSNTDKLPYRFYHQHHISSSLSGGLGLVTATDADVQRSPNVLESSSVKSTQLPSLPLAPPKRDLCVMGFIDDMGGGVDGLMSCTESLGFESSDERRFDDKIAEGMVENDGNSRSFQYRRSTPRMKYWRKRAGGEVKKFPPPLSSLRPNGQRNFFLRAVRKDGRLELTEVRIDRTEVLRASRQDGRLRLHLIRENDIQDCAEEVEGENRVVQQEVEPEQEEEEEEEENEVVVVAENEEKENVKGIEEEKEEEKFGEWKLFPWSGEGFRWCHELVSHHEHHHHTNHHHNLHAWRQHCVTTGN
ncbi:hypothetical protein F2P56_023666 [Juglans regia]|uniref:FAF domain-containing protein n=1 Tax=Juglans regia TaxID=51240 RepID=A0A833UAR8_JUGRE|nr:hypothetical protein F2P56_023666 [Juglans regia]